MIALAVAASLASGLSAQNRTDFSGVWRLDAAKTVTTGGPARAGARGAGSITEPRLLKRVPPKYPAKALSDRVAGFVIIDAVIDTQGNVSDLTIIRSAPEGVFDQATLDAVAQWQYAPTLLNGVPVPVTFTVTSNFSLPGARVSPTPPSRSAVTANHDVTIRQTDHVLTLTSSTPTPRTVTYDLDGRPTVLRSPEPGRDAAIERTYTSRWEDARLVTTITGPGLAGPHTETTETRWIEADAMIVEQTTPNVGGDQPMLVRQVFRKLR